jgi:hypothetical protein
MLTRYQAVQYSDFPSTPFSSTAGADTVSLRAVDFAPADRSSVLRALQPS